MKKINLNSKKGIVNLFADFILMNIDRSSNTIISVIDLGNFFIVNGITNLTTQIDLTPIKDKFINENRELLTSVGYGDNLNIMDIIVYGKEVFETEYREQLVTLYNSERPIFHPSVVNHISTDDYSIDYINNQTIHELGFNNYYTKDRRINIPIQMVSEYPHGYTLSMGRLQMYYSEHIAYQIFPTLLSDELTLQLTNSINEDRHIINLLSNSPYQSDKIKSMILDNFDFNYNTFSEKHLSTYDLCDDIKKPTAEKPWLVKNIHHEDLYIF